MFGTEEEEIRELCREVISDLRRQPGRRFYDSERIALNAAWEGLYVYDQVLLDWLFDLRRLSEPCLGDKLTIPAVMGAKTYEWRYVPPRGAMTPTMPRFW